MGLGRVKSMPDIILFSIFVKFFRCQVFPLDNSTLYPNLTEKDVLNYTTPYDKDSHEYDSCKR